MEVTCGIKNLTLYIYIYIYYIDPCKKNIYTILIVSYYLFLQQISILLHTLSLITNNCQF